jgi:hypothetical protein
MRRGKKKKKQKNRKRAGINEVTSVTYQLLVTFPSLQPRGRQTFSNLEVTLPVEAVDR